ncbi:uncharacterized protein LOC142585991 isoform X1 [Dermacentor variabilis]|uniref:uncharacterized protein LOC142585991 isoform X1 n=1 Tax=Dermacentor variabilis TaxID=34621 RepID=UPI003F5BD3D9
MLSMISFYSCGELIVKFCLKDGLKPLRKRLKRNAVPSQKIPMRSHEASVRPRVPRRKPPTDSQGNEGQQDDVSEVVINEDCACELPDNLEESEYNDPPVQDWLPPLSSSCSRTTAERDAARALVELQELGHTPELNKSVQVNSLDFTQKFRISDVLLSDAHLNTLTGVPSHALLNKIVSLVEKYEAANRMEASVRDRVILVFIVLKQAMSFSCLSVLFQCSISSIHRYFVHTLPLAAAVLKAAIEWPSKEEILNNMPSHFKQYPRVRGVVDCTEIPVERSRCVKCQLLTYSQYKSTYTVKFLICVSPAGTITFISEAFGGRASDKAITAECAILEKFESFTDDIMVDRGFFIDDLCTARAIGVIRPPFAKKDCQFDRNDALRTADIARAWVHVERAIQRVKIFKLFNSTLSWEMLPYINELFTVACGLTNLCAPILADDKFQ